MARILGQIAFGEARVTDRVRPLFDPTHFDATLALRAPIVKRSDNGSVAASGSPRYALTATDVGSLPDRLLASYRDEGASLLKRLRGAFALAVFDSERQSVLLAIDRMGIERLAWGVSDGCVAFGTSAAEVARLLSSSPKVNPQALFDYMLCHMVPAPDSAFVAVEKLLPGTAIEVNREGVHRLRYWDPDFGHKSAKAIPGLRERVLPTLGRAVALTQPNSQTGSFLSGGLDSSTVTGLLAGLQARKCDAFSVGFGVEEFNEIAYARTASKHFRCRLHEYEVTVDDVLDSIPRIAAACDEPFGNSSVVPTLSCVEFAKRSGMTHLLAGDGGDELFGGNERYASQRIFELYNCLPPFLRRHLLNPLARQFHPEHSFFPLRKFSSYVQQANIPLPERYESWNLIYREGSETVFSEDLLRQVDPHLQLTRMYDVWNSCPSGDLLDRMLWYDWKFTLADNDLRKVKQMCDLAGMSVSFPMLHEDVVDLSLQVPSNAKISRQELRSFYKDAVRGFLPDEIIKKKKHGFGLPFGHWLKADERLQELTYGSLSTLGERGIFLPEFLRKVATEHKKGHPGYYGYAIWDLVMLEQWLLATDRNYSVSS